MTKTELWVETSDGEVVASYADPSEYEAAKDHAGSINGVVVLAEFEFSDSSLLDDYRKNGTDD